MKKRWVQILASLGFGILFILGYLWFIDIFDPRRFTRWNPLPVARNRISQLLGIGYGSFSDMVYVQSVNGLIYRCCDTDNPDWEQHYGVQSWLTKPCEDPFDRYYPAFPDPPGRVIECLQRTTYEHVPNDFYFVLLQDGMVWRLHYYYGVDTFFFQLCGSGLVGGILGFILANSFGRRRARGRGL